MASLPTVGSPVTPPLATAPALSNPPKDAALHLLCLAAEGRNHQPPLLPSHPLPHHPHQQQLSQQQQQQHQQHQQQQHPHHSNYPIYFPPPPPPPHYHQSPHYLYHPYHYTTPPTPAQPPPPPPPPAHHQLIHSPLAYPHHQPPHQIQSVQSPHAHHLPPYSPLLPSRPSVLPLPLPVASPPVSPIPSHQVHKVKGPWRPEEDTILTELVSKFGPRRWTVIASHIPGRTGKQARERWLNQLSPHLAKRPWTPEEDRIVMDAHARLGNRWSEIAKLLNGRTDNATKNRFNTTIRRQISELSSHARQELAAGVKKADGVATSMVTTASKSTTPSTSPNNSDGETELKVGGGGVKRKREATSRVMEPLSQRPKTVTASS